MERGSSWLKVAIQSSYPLRANTPDGVTQFIIGLKPHLEKKGVKVRLIGPHIQDEEANLADFTFGRAVKVSHDKTTHETTLSFNKRRANQLAQTIREDILVIHEPLVLGHGAHTLISGTPKRESGEPIPAIIGHFHAQAEDISPAAKTVKAAAKLIRRPQFSQFRTHKGFTVGYVNTIVDALDGRIAVSNATADFWKKQIGGEFEVISNGIDTEELTPWGPKIESWNDGRKTIFAAARHDPRKGLEYAIRALGTLIHEGIQVKLKISGRGKETENLKALVAALGLNPFVEFLGIIPREELIKAYRSADLFVSPAIGGEGFGRTLAEAMACGTLTVGSDINGYREVLRDLPFTRMVPPKNPKALAGAIFEILNLPEVERERLQIQARIYVEKEFSWPRIADQTVRYYENVLIAHEKPHSKEWGRKKNGPIAKIPLVGTVFVREKTKSS